MKIAKAMLILSAAGLGLGLAACGGPKESAGEQHADAMSSAAEAPADQVDAMTRQAEQKTDAMAEAGAGKGAASGK